MPVADYINVLLIISSKAAEEGATKDLMLGESAVTNKRLRLETYERLAYLHYEPSPQLKRWEARSYSNLHVHSLKDNPRAGTDTKRPL